MGGVPLQGQVVKSLHDAHGEWRSAARRYRRNIDREAFTLEQDKAAYNRLVELSNDFWRHYQRASVGEKTRWRKDRQ